MEKPEEFVSPPAPTGTTEEGRMGQLTSALLALTENINVLVKGIAAAENVELPRKDK
ncbi:hypothetical protein K6V98_08365 [Collinsella sp. AGMB00827]|uniref:Uncharacterized protein n=1 Tax=Collinsella ureilytica TaxID=2869515 RepID=A0ABS7MM27_9ACTN|nr:hypothetical protein [Collinsella urealyticum]MBY4798358.1 hypothetical protein [Collinsella urealyticum]